MMGISISGPTLIHEDKMLVIHNTLKTESTLNRACNMIACCAICELMIMRESLTVHVKSENNPADL